MTGLSPREIIRFMLDLHDEMALLIRAMDAADIPYALCGGLSMAVHGVPRATIDIDLLVAPDSLDAVLALAAGRGFTLGAAPRSFAGGAVEIRRVTKIDPELGDALMLDLVLVGPALADVWRDRQCLEWNGGPLWVVSRDGLVRMKRLRGSGVDRDDILRLEGQDEG